MAFVWPQQGQEKKAAGIKGMRGTLHIAALVEGAVTREDGNPTPLEINGNGIRFLQDSLQHAKGSEFQCLGASIRRFIFFQSSQFSQTIDVLYCQENLDRYPAEKIPSPEERARDILAELDRQKKRTWQKWRDLAVVVVFAPADELTEPESVLLYELISRVLRGSPSLVGENYRALNTDLAQ